MCITSFGIFNCSKKRALKASEEIMKEFFHMITNFIDNFSFANIEIFIVHMAFSVHYHALFNTHMDKKGLQSLKLSAACQILGSKRKEKE